MRQCFPQPLRAVIFAESKRICTEMPRAKYEIERTGQPESFVPNNKVWEITTERKPEPETTSMGLALTYKHLVSTSIVGQPVSES